MADNLLALRQPILYAEEIWRRQRMWPLVMVSIGVVLTIFWVISRRGVFDANAAIVLAYVPIGLVFGGVLLIHRRRSYAEVAEQALIVSGLLRTVPVSYDLVRSVRVQKLEMHFQDNRKRLVRPLTKPLMPKPALFVRLRGDDPRVAELRRRLGSQLVSEDTIALPIPDPDAMAWEVTSRLPEKTGVNLGGQRRRKRPR
jgi:hypothetical protein